MDTISRRRNSSSSLLPVKHSSIMKPLYLRKEEEYNRKIKKEQEEKYKKYKTEQARLLNQYAVPSSRVVQEREREFKAETQYAAKVMEDERQREWKQRESELRAKTEAATAVINNRPESEIRGPSEVDINRAHENKSMTKSASIAHPPNSAIISRYAVSNMTSGSFSLSKKMPKIAVTPRYKSPTAPKSATTPRANSTGTYLRKHHQDGDRTASVTPSHSDNSNSQSTTPNHNAPQHPKSSKDSPRKRTYASTSQPRQISKSSDFISNEDLHEAEKEKIKIEKLKIEEAKAQLKLEETRIRLEKLKMEEETALLRQEVAILRGETTALRQEQEVLKNMSKSNQDSKQEQQQTSTLIQQELNQTLNNNEKKEQNSNLIIKSTPVQLSVDKRKENFKTDDDEYANEEFLSDTCLETVQEGNEEASHISEVEDDPGLSAKRSVKSKGAQKKLNKK